MGNPHRDRSRKRDDYNYNPSQDAFGSKFYDVGRTAAPRPQSDKPQRARLEFKQVTTIERGPLRAIVTAANGVHGNIYNFSVERQGRDHPIRFFRREDTAELVALLTEVENWINAQV